MNKVELTIAVAEKSGLKKRDAELAINSMLETIEEALAAGDKVQLIGFGTFETRKRSARKGRNPKTGEEIAIAESVVPAFKPGSNLKAATK